MAARNRLRLNLEPDRRTSEISDESLFCREYGHKWAVKPYSEATLRTWLKNGYIENSRWCEHGCGSTWVTIVETKNFTVVETKRHYPKDYLMKPGYGRLPRNEARKAAFVRNWPQFA